jgi:hypothetical protein
MSNLVHNEQVKLFAAFLNNLGIASLAAGAILPTISLSFFAHDLKVSILTLVVGVGFGTWLMWQAQNYLIRLKE